jgi:hypothetical protein
MYIKLNGKSEDNDLDGDDNDSENENNEKEPGGVNDSVEMPDDYFFGGMTLFFL